MTYNELHKLGLTKFNLNDKEIDFNDYIKVYNIPFESFHANILPGKDVYSCVEHQKQFKDINKDNDQLDLKTLNNIVNLKDHEIKENIKFNYTIIQSKVTKKLKKKSKKKALRDYHEAVSDVIILLHGLNEKDWTKYIPWAAKLVQTTGKSVLLFPLAFHMNRVPEMWVNPKLMTKVNKERKKLNPNLNQISFANAAISTRLQSRPDRYLWSGLQTFYDIVQLIREIRSGYNPQISKDAAIDFFAYSIGVFLGQILMMANPYNYLDKSKLFCFCGGPTLNRMSPTSRYIMDSEANISVYSFFIEHLETQLKRDKRLQHYFSKLHPEGNCFKSMLDYHKMKQFRECRFRELSKQIMAVALKKDKVIPYSEVINTLTGEDHDIPIKVKVLDFPYEYDHITPFPLKKNNAEEVDKNFNYVIKKAGKFFK